MFHGYQYDPKMLKAQRAAHALDWAAVHHRGDAVPYPILVKVIGGYERAPKLKSPEVESLRGSLSRIRKILLTQYDRGLVVVPGLAARATHYRLKELETVTNHKKEE